MSLGVVALNVVAAPQYNQEIELKLGAADYFHIYSYGPMRSIERVQLISDSRIEFSFDDFKTFLHFVKHSEEKLGNFCFRLDRGDCIIFSVSRSLLLAWLGKKAGGVRLLSFRIDRGSL